MCPWPRIQAALTDEYALNVTYRCDRGEPRGSLKKSAALRERAPAGDCIDCRQCVARLPDRRRHPRRRQARLHPLRAVHRCLRRGHGQDRPAGAADRLRHRRQHPAPRGRQAAVFKLVRARTVLYAAIIAVVGGVMLYTLATRQTERRQRHPRPQPDLRALADGSIRNGYTVRILNKSPETRSFALDGRRPAPAAEPRRRSGDTVAQRQSR